MRLPWPLTAILTHNENFKVFPGFTTFNIFLLYCCHTGSAGHYLSMGLHQVLLSLFLFYPLLPINIADMISEPRTNYSSLPGPPLQSKPKYNSWQLLAPCGHSHFNSDSINSSLALMAYMSFFKLTRPELVSGHLNYFLPGMLFPRTCPWVILCLIHFPLGSTHTSKNITTHLFPFYFLFFSISTYLPSNINNLLC